MSCVFDIKLEKADAGSATAPACELLGWRQNQLLTAETACINGVLDSSATLTQLTSAPWAKASAMTGKFCRAADRYNSAPGWRPLRSSSSSSTSEEEERLSFSLETEDWMYFLHTLYKLVFVTSPLCKLVLFFWTRSLGLSPEDKEQESGKDRRVARLIFTLLTNLSFSSCWFCTCLPVTRGRVARFGLGLSGGRSAVRSCVAARFLLALDRLNGGFLPVSGSFWINFLSTYFDLIHDSLSPLWDRDDGF